MHSICTSKTAAALYRAHINASVVPEETMKGKFGKLVRSPVLSPTLERFMRSIAAATDQSELTGPRTSLKPANASGYDRAGDFFLPSCSIPFFFTGSVRFVPWHESCSFISAAVVVHCIERSYRTQRCQTEENTATRCERACKTIRIFSTRTKCNPQLDVPYVVSEFIPVDFFRKQYRAVEHSAEV